MKKIIFLAGFVGCTLLPSCDSILDVQPESIITSGSFWKEPNDAKVYMNGIYSAVRKWSNTSYYGEDRGDSLSREKLDLLALHGHRNCLKAMLHHTATHITLFITAIYCSTECRN